MDKPRLGVGETRTESSCKVEKVLESLVVRGSNFKGSDYDLVGTTPISANMSVSISMHMPDYNASSNKATQVGIFTFATEFIRS